MLNTLLAKTENTAAENVHIYLKKRRVRNREQYHTDKRAVDALHRKFERKQRKNRRMKSRLREINEVVLYENDIENVIKAHRKYDLTVLQTKIFFGLLFFARMYNSEHCRVGTEWKFKQFCGCFKERIGFADMDFVRQYGLLLIFETGEEVFSRYRSAVPELDYIYEGAEEKTAVAYRHTVTVENNRLDLDAVFDAAMPKQWRVKRCEACGGIVFIRGNRQKYCEKCSHEKHKRQQRMAMKRKREREKAKQIAG